VVPAPIHPYFFIFIILLLTQNGVNMATMDSLVSYVLKSRNRLDVLKAIGSSVVTVNKISAKTHLKPATVRSILNDLQKKKLVKKTSGKDARTMLCEATRLGKTVLQMKDASGRIKWKGTSRQKRIIRLVKIELETL
jgi:DNA-binding MarR family transcriptional regulator